MASRTRTRTSIAITLKPGRNVITVEVTAEDGTTKRVYTITVTRLTSEGPEDASLATLTLTAVTADDDHGCDDREARSQRSVA